VSARHRLALVALLCLGMTPDEVLAEGFFDLYAGLAVTVSNDVASTSSENERTVDRFDFKDSFSVGGRLGYWWGAVGMNLDVSYFRPELDPDDFEGTLVSTTTDLDVVGVGLNLMARGRFLKSADLSDGRLQPYVFAGPTVFVSRFAFDVSGRGRRRSVSDSAVSTTVGLTAGGGVTFMLARQIGLFAEYRFTRNRPQFQFEGFTLEPKLDSHHVVAGVTLRF